MPSLELKMPPLFLMSLFALWMWAASAATPLLHLAVPGASILAWVAVAAGALAAASGVYEFRKARTTVDPRTPDKSEALVVAGIYRFSRNPMYVGFLLVLIGWAVHLSNLAAFLFPPLFVLYMNRYQIVPEERYLREKFGAGFESYAEQVRRWL